MSASIVLHPLPACGFDGWLDGAVKRLGLNVLAANEAARRLHEQPGFQVHSLQMSRTLPQPVA